MEGGNRFEEKKYQDLGTQGSSYWREGETRFEERK
jgi:hypothetical protein